MPLYAPFKIKIEQHALHLPCRQTRGANELIQRNRRGREQRQNQFARVRWITARDVGFRASHWVRAAGAAVSASAIPRERKTDPVRRTAALRQSQASLR